MRFKGRLAWIAGVVSGLLGGLVRNRGGIRSAALLGFDLDRQIVVATETAIGLIVDAARMPLYFWSQREELAGLTAPMAVATAGVLIGTVIGSRVLVRIPEHRFRRVVAVIVGVLGALMIVRGIRNDEPSKGG
jgi:uncharacterized protein